MTSKKDAPAQAEQKSISEQASVAPNTGTMRRSINMGHFLAPDEIREGRAISQKTRVAFNGPETLGQLVGAVYSVEERHGQVNGDPTVSYACLGEFEGTNYATGEVFESSVAYLPNYYGQALMAQLANSATKGVAIGVEIVLEPTGKEIPVAYVLRNLIDREPMNPVNLVKQKLAQSNRLRLPPPVALPAPPQLALPAGAAPVDGEGAPEEAAA